MITIYFKHIVITPGAVRETWSDAIAVPRAGDWVILHCGHMGTRVTWEVRSVEWNSSRSVTCFMSGPDGRQEWEQRQADAQLVLAEVSG